MHHIRGVAHGAEAGHAAALCLKRIDRKALVATNNTIFGAAAANQGAAAGVKSGAFNMGSSAIPVMRGISGAPGMAGPPLPASESEQC